MKTLGLVFLITLLFSHSNAVTVNLHASAGRSFDITYSTPELDETLRVGFTANLNSAMTSGNVASVICMRADDLTYTISDGTSTNAFGFMFGCSQSICTDSLDLSANLIGGTVSYSSNTYTWRTGTDVSNTNRGNTGTATEPTSTFGLRADSEIWSNIPLEDTTAYLRCWGRYNVASATGTINSPALDVSSWPVSSETVSVTTAQLSATTTTSSSTSGAYEKLSYGLIFLVSTITAIMY
ncbi:unnamed protein product [Moneuplotes crassus]|uniref:Uncharacterized protein n=1 Tax=Euplotes crassus TaxID=5936 RepID=A0AAD1XUC2_EUPCR|nr:unnamed protein product [Moneuplotes crassus]